MSITMVLLSRLALKVNKVKLVAVVTFCGTLPLQVTCTGGGGEAGSRQREFKWPGWVSLTRTSAKT
jgi:hypothetical protein